MGTPPPGIRAWTPADLFTMTCPAPTRLASTVRQNFDFSRLPSAFFPLVDEWPEAGCELCVAIPVHNEETGLAAALGALAAQVDFDGRPLDPASYEVLVLANNCTDRSTEVARAFGAAHRRFRLHVIEITLEAPHAHVGAARRIVVDEACRRLASLGRRRGVVASTDGDTQVRPDWVAATLREVARGADAVGGRIEATAEEIATLDPGARRYYRRDRAYRMLRAAYESALDPDPFNAWPRHHCCFGASLAVTVETYLATEGIPVVPCLEDMAFHRELERIGARVRQSPEVGVLTSLRCAGRVGVGLSGTLSIWTRAAAGGEPWMVDSPAAIELEAVHRARVRALCSREVTPRHAAQAAAELQVDAEWFEGAWRTAAGHGALYQQVRERQRETGVGPGAVPPMEVTAAAAGLRERLAVHRPGLRMASRLARTGRAGIFPPAGRTKCTSGPEPGLCRFQKCLVNLVTRQRVVVDQGRPVNQQKLPGRAQVG